MLRSLYTHIPYNKDIRNYRVKNNLCIVVKVDEDSQDLKPVLEIQDETTDTPTIFNLTISKCPCKHRVSQTAEGASGNPSKKRIASDNAEMADMRSYLDYVIFRSVTIKQFGHAAQDNDKLHLLLEALNDVLGGDLIMTAKIVWDKQPFWGSEPIAATKSEYATLRNFFGVLNVL